MTVIFVHVAGFVIYQWRTCLVPTVSVYNTDTVKSPWLHTFYMRLEARYVVLDLYKISKTHPAKWTDISITDSRWIKDLTAGLICSGKKASNDLDPRIYGLYPAGKNMLRVNNSKTRMIEKFIGTAYDKLPCNHFLEVAIEVMHSFLDVLKSFTKSFGKQWCWSTFFAKLRTSNLKFCYERGTLPCVKIPEQSLGRKLRNGCFFFMC